MQLGKALDQIAEIHGHLAKGEVYRGYRPTPVALTGAVAIGCALLEPRLGAHDPASRIRLWLVAAVLAACIPATEILRRYLAHDDAYARRRTRRVVGQFLPSVFAGGALAALALGPAPGLASLLPGLWSLVFGLGIFASRPYLPRATGFVALYYVLAGAAVLALDPGWGSPLSMGAPFGAGQIAAAWVLWRDLDRVEA